MSRTVAINTIIVAGINHGNCPTKKSICVSSKMVATTLFIKCTLIGTSILSVFRYRMHMHNPNRNALVIPPKSCPIPNKNDEINIAGMMPILIFSLLNRTPLKTNSSKIGAKIMEAIALNRNAPADMSTESISKPVTQFGS